MCAPSSIDNKKYEWINSFNTHKIEEMPSDLIQFLLIDNINKKTNVKKNKKCIIEDIVYDTTMRWLINDE